MVAERIVSYRKTDGRWHVLLPGWRRGVVTSADVGEAIAAARSAVRCAGGGTVTVFNRVGKITRAETIDATGAVLSSRSSRP